MRIATGLDEPARKDIAEGLTHILADTYTLYLKTQGCHWNVTGRDFPPLHDLFEAQYRELADAVDTVAERIRALDIAAPASYGEYARLSSIPDEPATADAADALRRLRGGHETLARATRKLLPLAAHGDDQATADLLAERMRAHEHAAWMLRSTLGD